MVLRTATFIILMASLVPLPSFPQSSTAKQQQIDSRVREAQSYLKSGHPELAAREFSAILDLDPGNLEAQTNLGVVLYFQANYAQAALHLRKALQLRPSLWNIQALLGMCERRMGQPAAARTDLEKAFSGLKEEKVRVQTGMELMEIYYGEGYLDKAAEVLAVLRQLRPTDPDVLYTAYRIYSDLAGESMLSIAMSAPKSARMHQVMAQELARHEKPEAAIAHYRMALKIDPKLSGLHFELAELLEAGSGENSQAEAEAEYKAALAVDPFDQKSECRLGEIEFRASELKSAFEHYSRAVTLQPDDADANLGLGKTLAAMHQPVRARAQLEHAVRLEPFDAETHYRLASVYRELGLPSDAERELAEFRKMKDMKNRLDQIYQEMRIRPKRQQGAEPEIPK
jgi:tetratricopeptide (TPR) repeat protein